MWFFNWLIWLGSFTDNRVGIFRFFDGKRLRKVDAMEVALCLFSHQKFDWDETPNLIHSGDVSSQLIAVQTTADAVREAFDVPSVDAGGLAVSGCLDLLDAFRSYLGNPKKSGSLFPSMSEPQAPALSPLEMPAPLPSADPA